MSSLTRRIQKTILKRRGYYRNKSGMVCDSTGEVVGKNWPVLLKTDEEKGVA